MPPDAGEPGNSAPPSQSSRIPPHGIRSWMVAIGGLLHNAAYRGRGDRSPCARQRVFGRVSEGVVQRDGLWYLNLAGIVLTCPAVALR